MTKQEVFKTHWLHGKIRFNVDVKEEDDCTKCVHWHVCKRTMAEFCLNYEFGTSQKTSCDGCIHRFTRKIWHKQDGFPCFDCKYFEKEE